MINSYPVGLHAKKDYFRVLDTVFNNDVKDFILTRMKSSHNNIKPVMVIDSVTKRVSMFIPNNDLTSLVLKANNESNLLMRIKIESISEWHIRKTRVQLSSLSRQDKEESCDLITKAFMKKIRLTAQEQARLTDIEGRI